MPSAWKRGRCACCVRGYHVYSLYSNGEYRTLGINEEQEQPERQLVSRKLLQTLSIGASCERQARYSTAYVAYGREVPADIQAPLSLLFRRRSILKLLRRLTIGLRATWNTTRYQSEKIYRVLWQSFVNVPYT